MHIPRKIFFSRIGIVFVSLTGFFVNTASAKEIPDPVFKTSSTEIKKMVEEREYYYRTMQYEPAVVVNPVKKQESSYKTPEASAISFISAMFAFDPKWHRESWTADSIIKMDEEDKKEKQGPDFWAKAWKRVLTDRKARITHRIETGSYVIIGYELFWTIKNPDPKQKEFIKSSIVLKKENNKWLATQELSSDPVAIWWRSPDQKLPPIMGRNINLH